MKKTALFFAATLALSACSDLRQLAVITLGAPEIPAFEVDRTYDLSAEDFSGCPEGTRTIQDQSGTDRTLTVSKTATGCLLAFNEPNLILFDEDQARRGGQALEGWDISAIKSASVIIESYTVLDADGAPVDTAAWFNDLELTIDGEVILAHADLAALANGPVKKTISAALLDKIGNAFGTGAAATADVAARVEAKDSALASLPAKITLQAKIQPEVTVDVVEALAN